MIWNACCPNCKVDIPFKDVEQDFHCPACRARLVSNVRGLKFVGKVLAIMTGLLVLPVLTFLFQRLWEDSYWFAEALTIISMVMFYQFLVLHKLIMVVFVNKLGTTGPGLNSECVDE